MIRLTLKTQIFKITYTQKYFQNLFQKPDIIWALFELPLKLISISSSTYMPMSSTPKHVCYAWWQHNEPTSRSRSLSLCSSSPDSICMPPSPACDTSNRPHPTSSTPAITACNISLHHPIRPLRRPQLLWRHHDVKALPTWLPPFPFSFTMHEKQRNQHGTHLQHTQKQQKQHTHSISNKHVQRQQHKDELATKAALHCQPPQNVLLSCLVCPFHPITSLLASMPHRLRATVVPPKGHQGE